jgi:hypothetical protein
MLAFDDRDFFKPTLGRRCERVNSSSGNLQRHSRSIGPIATARRGEDVDPNRSKQRGQQRLLLNVTRMMEREGEAAEFGID